MKSIITDADFSFQKYQYNGKKNPSKLDKTQYIGQIFDDFYALRNEGKYNEILDVETDVAPKVQMKKLYDLREAAYIKKWENKIKKEKDKILYEKFLSDSAKKKAAISEGDPERDTKKARYEDDIDMKSLTSCAEIAFHFFHLDGSDKEESVFKEEIIQGEVRCQRRRSGPSMQILQSGIQSFID